VKYTPRSPSRVRSSRARIPALAFGAAGLLCAGTATAQQAPPGDYPPVSQQPPPAAPPSQPAQAPPPAMQPMQPAPVMQPVQPYQPVQPVQPVQPMQPMQPAMVMQPPPPAPAPEEAGPRPYVSLTMGIFYYQFFGVGLGATVGVHLLPQTVLEIDAYTAAALAPTQTSDSVALRVQQMVGKLAYVRGGVRYRRLELTRVLDFDEYEEKLRQRDLGVDMAVGARWDRSNFILGVDGIGAYVPVQSFFTEQQVVDETNGELLAAERPGLRGRWDVRLGYLYLGARF
jgi:hypothetical protein